MSRTYLKTLRTAGLAARKFERNARKRPGFESPWPVAVSQVADGWELTEWLRFRTQDGRLFVVPVGATTDFASIPSFLTWLVPSTTGIAAAVLHDALWRHEATLGGPKCGKLVDNEWCVLQPHSEDSPCYGASDVGREPPTTHRDADNILYEALRSLGVSRVRASTMWAAVRLGALTQPGGRQGWHKDAPAVICISVLMLPLLTVGLALVPVAAVYKLVEWVIG